MSTRLPTRVSGWGLAAFLATVALAPWLAPNAYIVQILAFAGLNAMMAVGPEPPDGVRGPGLARPRRLLRPRGLRLGGALGARFGALAVARHADRGGGHRAHRVRHRHPDAPAQVVLPRHGHPRHRHHSSAGLRPALPVDGWLVGARRHPALGPGAAPVRQGHRALLPHLGLRGRGAVDRLEPGELRGRARPPRRRRQRGGGGGHGRGHRAGEAADVRPFRGVRVAGGEPLRPLHHRDQPRDLLVPVLGAARPDGRHRRHRALLGPGAGGAPAHGAARAAPPLRRLRGAALRAGPHPRHAVPSPRPRRAPRAARRAPAGAAMPRVAPLARVAPPLAGGALLEVRGLSGSSAAYGPSTSAGSTSRPGEIKAIIGPNGAGKTTVFNLITGVYRRARARCGSRASASPGSALARWRASGSAARSRTSSSSRASPWSRTSWSGRPDRRRDDFAGAALGLPGPARENRAQLERASAALALVGLERAAWAPAASLPFGQQKLVEVARAVAAGPTLLLLDEPAAGLNSTEKVEMMRLIGRLRELGMALLLIEHDMRLVMGVSDRVVVLDHGEKIAEGTPAEVQADPRSSRCTSARRSRIVLEVHDLVGPLRRGGGAPGRVARGAAGRAGHASRRQRRRQVHAAARPSSGSSEPPAGRVVFEGVRHHRPRARQRASGPASRWCPSAAASSRSLPVRDNLLLGGVCAAARPGLRPPGRRGARRGASPLPGAPRARRPARGHALRAASSRCWPSAAPSWDGRGSCSATSRRSAWPRWWCRRSCGCSRALRERGHHGAAGGAERPHGPARRRPRVRARDGPRGALRHGRRAARGRSTQGRLPRRVGAPGKAFRHVRDERSVAPGISGAGEALRGAALPTLLRPREPGAPRAVQPGEGLAWNPETDIAWSRFDASAYSAPVREAARLVWSRRAWGAYPGLGENTALLIRFCLESGAAGMDAKLFLSFRPAEEAKHLEACLPLRPAPRRLRGRSRRGRRARQQSPVCPDGPRSRLAGGSVRGRARLSRRPARSEPLPEPSAAEPRRGGAPDPAIDRRRQAAPRAVRVDAARRPAAAALDDEGRAAVGEAVRECWSA